MTSKPSTRDGYDPAYTAHSPKKSPASAPTTKRWWTAGKIELISSIMGDQMQPQQESPTYERV